VSWWNLRDSGTLLLREVQAEKQQKSSQEKHSREEIPMHIGLNFPVTEIGIDPVAIRDYAQAGSGGIGLRPPPDIRPRFRSGPPESSRLAAAIYPLRYVP
jgi:hypothetical protein